MNDFFKTFANLPGSQKNIEKTIFKYEGDDLIEKAYQIGVYLDLLPGVDFQKFITTGWALEKHNCNSLYDIDISEQEKIELLQEHLKEFAIEHHRAFIVDWKWSVTDVLFNITQIIPEFRIKIDTENERNDTWQVTFDYEGTKEMKEFKFDEIFTLIEYLNGRLSEHKINLNFYSAVEFADNYYFFCMDSLKVDAAFESEFFDIQN